jgi:hypothetical protein
MSFAFMPLYTGDYLRDCRQKRSMRSVVEVMLVIASPGMRSGAQTETDEKTYPFRNPSSWHIPFDVNVLAAAGLRDVVSNLHPQQMIHIDAKGKQ